MGLGAWVTIDGLVNRADLNGKVGLVVRPDPGDGRLGVAIGVDSVRVKLSNLRLTDGTMPTPLRTVHTLDDMHQTDSPRNMGRFLNWIHGLENVDDANWFIGQVVACPIVHAVCRPLVCRHCNPRSSSQSKERARSSSWLPARFVDPFRCDKSCKLVRPPPAALSHHLTESWIILQHFIRHELKAD